MNTKFFILTVSAMAFAACSQMENPIEEIATEEPAEIKVPVALSYSTIDAVETKAAQDLNQGTFDSDESVMVRVSNTGANAWADYIFTTGSAGAMAAPDPGPYYPAGTQNIDIVAYYPASAGTSFTVASDQTADADYKTSDLMFASVTNQAKQAEAVNLAFSHKMAKLCVNITPGQGVTSINSLSVLNVMPTVSFNQTTGEVGTASGDASSISMSNNGAAIIPAQTINGGLLSIDTDKGTATYSVTNKVFEAGKLYTINITVNLRAVGTTTAITGWTSEGTVTVNPVAKDRAPEGVEAVDLGHPDGVKWATMNVGAKTVTGYGDYFAWGAIYPYYIEHDAYGNEITGQWLDGKTAYDWANYPFMQSGMSSSDYITKYTFADGDTSGIWYDGDTFKGDNGDGVEHKDFASYDYADDAARQNWGANWRTPTDAEWTWLRENCTWTWTDNYNGTGVNGMLVRSTIAGYTDNTIFLPAAGNWRNADLNNVGDYGNYWSSSITGSYSSIAGLLHFSSIRGGTYNRETEIRSRGLSVRPVTE